MTDTKTKEELIKEGFDNWEKAIDTMVEQATEGYMPLVASTFSLAKEIMKVYRKAYTEAVKKGVEKNE
jgi:hypothetical protein